MSYGSPWLIPDTHLGHHKLITNNWRPPDYEEQIINNWRALVHPEDVVIHLGDVAMSREGWYHENVISKLPGRKILIRGNHDKKPDSWYLQRGWSLIRDHMFMTEEVGDVLWRVVLSHKPLSREPMIDYNIHGHLHNDDHRLNTEEVQSVLQPNRYHRLLAIECMGYKPVRLDEFLAGTSAMQCHIGTHVCGVTSV